MKRCVRDWRTWRDRIVFLREEPMNCPAKSNQHSDILLDYCAGKLAPAQVAAFEEHMNGCGDCKGIAAAQRSVWMALDQWKPADVAPEFNARIYQRIDEAQPGWTSWWNRMLHPVVPYSFWKPAVSLAAACSVLAIGFMIHTPEPRDASKQVRADKVDIEQVEKTLEDLDMLTPVSQSGSGS
jgi:hypothetical protein